MAVGENMQLLMHIIQVKKNRDAPSCQSAQCLHCFTFIKHTKCKSPTQHKATSSQTCVVRKCQLFTQVITKAMILCKYSRYCRQLVCEHNTQETTNLTSSTSNSPSGSELHTQAHKDIVSKALFLARYNGHHHGTTTTTTRRWAGVGLGGFGG